MRPNWFFAVPRIWEKLKAALEIGFEQEQDPMRRKAVEVALDVGRRKMEAEQAGEGVPESWPRNPAAPTVPCSRQSASGVGLDQLECVNVAAAPCPREVIEFFHAIGIPLAELWGMSETCAPAPATRPSGSRSAPSGRRRRGRAEARRGRRDAVRGEIVMAGYRNQPEKTAEAIDPRAGCTRATSASSTRTAT